MADCDPTLPKSTVEGPTSAVLQRERLLHTFPPPIVPPADSGELSHLIQLRRSVLADLIEDALVELDTMEGDPDLENATNLEDEGIVPGSYDTGGAGCQVSDPDGPSSAEWLTLGRFKGTELKGSLPHEDVEEDDGDTSVEDDPRGFDPEEDRCGAGDDGVFSGATVLGYYGTKYDGPGDADDAEREQLPHDVPCLPVFALEPNPFDGKREYLGMSNLQLSFRGNGERMVSAD
jgi:hypothetical protein